MHICISFRSHSGCWQFLGLFWIPGSPGPYLVLQACISFCSVSRQRAEYCFESAVSEKRTHWASLSYAANSVSSARSSGSSLLHTHDRPRGAHWVRTPELSELQKTHWVPCLKSYSPKPYSARFRVSDKTGALLFWPGSPKSAVAQT